jgi:hypothetical protein
MFLPLLFLQSLGLFFLGQRKFLLFRHIAQASFLLKIL